MNVYRRLLATFLIILSCLFAFQSAGAVNAPVSPMTEPACLDAGSLPDDVPTWVLVQQRDNAGCVAVSGDSACTDLTPLPANFPDWIEKPACTFVESDEDVVAAEVCPRIGPTVFNLGVGSATFASAPPCFVVGSYPGNDSGNTTAVRVPIEGSITAMNGEPTVARQDDTASADTTAAPGAVQNLPSNIGPTI